MVPTIQTRVVQQSFRNSRVSARGTRPGTSTLLGGACSTPTAHWFLLVGGGCRCVMTSITRIGIRDCVGDPGCLPGYFDLPGDLYDGPFWEPRVCNPLRYKGCGVGNLQPRFER